LIQVIGVGAGVGESTHIRAPGIDQNENVQKVFTWKLLLRKNASFVTSYRAYALHVEGIIGPIAGPSTLEHVKCRETVHAMALTAYLC
jgi:hypothetical protein